MTPLDPKVKAHYAGDYGPEGIEAWAGLLRVHAKLTRQLDARIASSHGLALNELEVLMRLAINGGSMRMSDLADAALLSRSGMTRIIDELEDLGYVEREVSRDDGRVMVARLTPEGTEVYGSARSAHVANVGELFLGRLSDEGRRALAAAWTAIEDGLPDEVPSGSGSRGIRTRRRRARRR